VRPDEREAREVQAAHAAVDAAQAGDIAAVLAACERIGYGRVMQVASDAWRKKDPVGALLVGEAAGRPLFQTARGGLRRWGPVATTTADCMYTQVEPCRTNWPDDRDQWCGYCVAAHAREARRTENT
jgi:hypothetical protein